MGALLCAGRQILDGDDPVPGFWCPAMLGDDFAAHGKDGALSSPSKDHLSILYIVKIYLPLNG